MFMGLRNYKKKKRRKRRPKREGATSTVSMVVSMGKAYSLYHSVICTSRTALFESRTRASLAQRCLPNTSKFDSRHVAHLKLLPHRHTREGKKDMSARIPHRIPVSTSPSHSCWPYPSQLRWELTQLLYRSLLTTQPNLVLPSTTGNLGYYMFACVYLDKWVGPCKLAVVL